MGAFEWKNNWNPRIEFVSLNYYMILFSWFFFPRLLLLMLLIKLFSDMKRPVEEAALNTDGNASETVQRKIPELIKKPKSQSFENVWWRGYRFSFKIWVDLPTISTFRCTVWKVFYAQGYNHTCNCHSVRSSYFLDLLFLNLGQIL